MQKILTSLSSMQCRLQIYNLGNMSVQISLDEQKVRWFLLTMLYDSHTVIKLPSTHVSNI